MGDLARAWSERQSPRVRNASCFLALFAFAASSALASACSNGTAEDAGNDAGAVPEAAVVDAWTETDAGTKADAASDAGKKNDGAPACTADLQNDPSNCGACGHACCGSECKRGLCSPSSLRTGLTSTAQLVGSLAVDTQHLYLVGRAQAASVVARIAKDGSGGAPIATAAAGAWISSLAIDTTDVFYAEASGSNLDGRVLRVSKSGGAPIELAHGLTGAVAVAVDASAVYYSTDSGLFRIAKSGGAPTPLASYPTKKLRGAPTQIAQDATSLYYDVLTHPDGASSWSGDVMKVSKSGGSAAPIATDIHLLSYVIAAEGTDVFVRTDYEFYPGSPLYPQNAAVIRIPSGGGAPVTIDEETSQSAVTGLASPVRVDNADVYYLTVFTLNGASRASPKFKSLGAVSGYEFGIDDRCAYVMTGQPELTVLTK